MEIISSATAQYGDCWGTVCIDSFNGVELQRLAREKIPSGYFPVGFSIWGLGNKNVTVYAVKTSEAGESADEVIAFAKGRTEDNPLPVYAFEVKIQPKELASAIKRFNIVGKSRVVGDVPFGVVEHATTLDKIEFKCPHPDCGKAFTLSKKKCLEAWAKAKEAGSPKMVMCRECKRPFEIGEGLPEEEDADEQEETE